MRRGVLISLMFAAAATAQVPAGEKRIVAGAGAEIVVAKCGVCHDLSHITRSRLGRGEWEDNLVMMVKRGMPPLSESANSVVLDYLTENYGPKGPAPGAPLFGATAVGAASDVKQLLVVHGCTGCHADDSRLVGPSFREVAAKYAGGAEVSRLVRKVREGGAGIWGQVPMPAMPQLTPADAEALVRHVLAVK